jgi:hypothetical protein
MSNTKPAATRAPLRGGKLAELLGVDLKTLHNWHRKGKLPGHRTLGGQLVFEPASVLTCYETARAADPDVQIPEAFAEYMKTGALPVTPKRKRVRAGASRREERGAA